MEDYQVRYNKIEATIMRIIAKQGNSRYLISLEDNIFEVNSNPNACGRVLDLASKRLFPPFNIHSIYTRGPWEPAEVSETQLSIWLQEIMDTTPKSVL